MVRYFGWYSNKMRGVRHRQNQELGPEQKPPPKTSGQVIRIPPPPPAPRIPSKKWRDLIQKVWHADPLRCPVCQNRMRMIAVIVEAQVIEKILRHLNLWSGPAPPPTVGRSPPDGYTYVPCDDVDPMPDYDSVLVDWSSSSRKKHAQTALNKQFSYDTAPIAQTSEPKPAPSSAAGLNLATNAS